MNYGPLIFLAAFFALASSWFGFVLTPQLQLGQLVQTNTVPAGVSYPLARPGLAQQGSQVYRANGCAYCHSQQVVQHGTAIDVLLTEIGTNRPALEAVLPKVSTGLMPADIKDLLSRLPERVLASVPKDQAEAAIKQLNATGAKAAIWIRPVGPDIARGWGRRRSVAEDFLFDYPVMLGSQRIGPDLANLGIRQPDVNWHLRHLYAPDAVVKGSSMPPYRYLFKTQKIRRHPSPEALTLPPALDPPAGYEVVPTAAGQALAAYLVSLRADVPLFSAPASVALPVASPGTTNAVPQGTTNALAGQAPAPADLNASADAAAHTNVPPAGAPSP